LWHSSHSLRFADAVAFADLLYDFTHLFSVFTVQAYFSAAQIAVEYFKLSLVRTLSKALVTA